MPCKQESKQCSTAPRRLLETSKTHLLISKPKAKIYLLSFKSKKTGVAYTVEDESCDVDEFCFSFLPWIAYYDKEIAYTNNGG